MSPPDELSRWQGSVDAELKGVKKDVGDLQEAQRLSDQGHVALQVQIASLKTQIGVWSAAGGLIGAGIVSGLAAWLGAH